MARTCPAPPEWMSVIGAPVDVRRDNGTVLETVTRSAPWQLGHGQWVVAVEGISGGYDIARVSQRTPGVLECLVESQKADTAAHTPTPWRRGKVSDAIVADAPVRPFDDAEDIAYYGGSLIAESVTVANQEFIVRACNAHHELVAALKRAVEAIRAFHGIGLNGPAIEEHMWTLYQQSPEMKAINAAIAKAEGAQ